MSFGAWTYLAIVVLVLGAPLVFAWFLTEAGELLRALRRGEPEGGERGETPLP